MPNILEMMKAELVEGASLLRRHYPDDDEQRLLDRAAYWRPWRYQHGHWPTVRDIAKAKAAASEDLTHEQIEALAEIAAEKAAAEKAAAEKADAEADAAA